uniref:Protein kinase domain-containing protein n=1 Tax=Noctiluca scintillans TaxID=2966 RepID=A0A7S1AJX1_NOCSC|mmetsp:Transcript_49393/g.131044  ORF Transcript_49393/g.131044 Transcript_49393/m.131044 type:complete len:425 (+) Transcript_49393:53-1327(+)
MGCTVSNNNPSAHISPSVAEPSERRNEFHVNYRLGAVLGKGTFAQVRLARDAESRQVAVKIISGWVPGETRPGNRPPNKKVCSDVDMEVKCWKLIGKHNHCVELYEDHEDSMFFYLVMERCDASLLEVLKTTSTLTERKLGLYVRDMLSGLKHLHHVGVVHRDVKPDNCLCQGDENRVKLADFGLSALSSTELKGVYGTPPFMSPEMLQKVPYDSKTDTWSLGVLAYVLFYGRFPYWSPEKTIKAMKEAIRTGTATPNYHVFKNVGENVKPSSRVRTFVQKCLRRTPDERVTAAEALTSLQPVIDADERDMPSLHHMLYGALKVGAFDALRQNTDGQIDAALDALQQKVWGGPMDLAMTRPKRTNLHRDRDRDNKDKQFPPFSVSASSETAASSRTPRLRCSESTPSMTMTMSDTDALSIRSVN